MKEETVFRVGDKVYDFFRGWGVIIENYNTITEFPIRVQFNEGLGSYTLDGKYFEADTHRILSFTEYDLVNGGFSQVRPCKFKKYEPVMGTTIGEIWFLHLHSGKSDEEVLTDPKNSDSTEKYHTVLTLDEWKEKFNIK